MKYDVIVAGSVINTFKTKEEAEKYLEQVRNSWLSLVHPQEVFRIKERAQKPSFFVAALALGSAPILACLNKLQNFKTQNPACLNKLPIP